MKITRLTVLPLLAPLLLGGVSFAQKGGLGTAPTGGPDGGPAGGGGAGGTFGGPGDTVGGGPNGGNPNPNGNGPAPPPPGPAGPGNPTYNPGGDPLNPTLPPPGVEGFPGSPTATPPPITPASPPTVDNPNSWQLWWHYNRWAHLRATSLVDTGGSGFYLGHGEKELASPLLRATKNQVRDIVQPALTSALKRGGSGDFEIYTLQALAKIRGVPRAETVEDFADLAEKLLRDGGQVVAEKAIVALGIRGEERFLPWLTDILADTTSGRALLGRSKVGHRMRAFAAYSLGLLAERVSKPEVRLRIMAALNESLEVEREEVQAACLFALGLTPLQLPGEGLDGVPLAGVTRVDQVLRLLSFFEDKEQPFVARSQAPGALARLVDGVPESLRSRVAYALLVASGIHSKEQREVQNAAVIALGKIGRSGPEPIDREIRDQLERIAFKASGDRSTRYLAMVALAESAGRPGRGEERLSGIEPVRRNLVRSLPRARGERLSWMAIALGLLEEGAARRGEVAAPESGKALRQALLKTRGAETSSAIAVALGMMRDQEAAELLLERMRTTGDSMTRAYSALALGMIRAPGAIPAVRDVLTVSTHQPRVVENAAISLALLGDQETGSRLFKILQASANPKVQASVASAMGWIKDPRPLLDLTRMVSDTRRNDTARAWTAVCIGRICDQDDWPWVGRLSVDALYDVFLPTLIEPTYQTGLLDLP